MDIRNVLNCTPVSENTPEYRQTHIYICKYKKQSTVCLPCNDGEHRVTTPGSTRVAAAHGYKGKIEIYKMKQLVFSEHFLCNLAMFARIIYADLTRNDLNSQ
jgi:hypothetical protein